ncbi:hypothetical protein ACU6U9_11040 [Pseudomonas sp. HK3]|jgi:hypothetical protein
MSTQDEIHFKLMRLIEPSNLLSQRQLAEEMGTSLALARLIAASKALLKKHG